jgi:multiple sugar transport system permease protein
MTSITASPSPTRARRRRGRRLAVALRTLAVVVLILLTSIPTAWIVLTGFKTEAEYLSSPPVWVPQRPTLANYEEMWSDGGAKAFANSLTVTLGGTLIAVAGGVLAAYSLSRFQTGGAGLANWILSVRFLPPIAFAIPLALMLQALGLVDTHLGLILVYGAFNLPFVIWTMKGFFDEVPTQIDESALIDGCTSMGALVRVVLPLAAAGLVSTTLLTFIFIWSEFLFALVLSQSALFTIPVRLSQYYSEAVGLRWGPQAALATLAMLPMIAMALLGQAFLVRAMSYGALKE